MKLTTVLGSVNDNPEYYMFIPKQIHFWNKCNIRFIAIFVGKSIPTILEAYKDNIILWDTMLYLNTAYLGQNLRMYYAALLDLPAGEAVMLTDMDMLPMNSTYYTHGLESYTDEDFIYYRHIEGNEIFMCYNAAHPSLWAKLFSITSRSDIEQRLFEEYNFSYTGIPGTTGWFTDQYIMHNRLKEYQGLKVLNRPLKRLEMDEYAFRLNQGDTNFIKEYDDAHFHRSYYTNEQLILDAEKQLAFFPLI
jgi:hypothetical protein